ncbi:hypothetical protein CA14_003208 [Aspergillus flavus]|uniref:Glycosyltransferase family 25 protein n=1 Tax=Aspergillus flavus TaxID=5059 RepID=A0AB74C2C8_ASPFL|nr:hypothetical protein CA14_003208 [Aspergillus flavus]
MHQSGILRKTAMFLATRQLLLVGTAASFLLLLWYTQRIFVSRTVSLPAPTLTPTPTPVPTPAERVSTTPKPPVQSAGNSTLGFQSILALSTGPSWRTRGLLAAASLTGLDIQIPPQPPINPNLVDAFEHMGPDNVQHPSHGASIAWLAHLDLIKHTIQANLDTVLIIEDDVDWDVSIRSQMVQIAESVRNLTHIDTLDQDMEPYGREWEVLWIGHCGEYWEEQFETVLYDDPTACPHSDYFGWAKQYIERLPDRQRAVYRSVNPVCSFAYALSREGSRKILELLGGAQDEAFDVSMMHACKAGQLKCISVVPEVVHQYFPAQSFGVKSAVDVGNGQEPGPEEAEFEHVMGSTENILESARCRALWGQRCLRKQ